MCISQIQLFISSPSVFHSCLHFVQIFNPPLLHHHYHYYHQIQFPGLDSCWSIQLSAHFCTTLLFSHELQRHARMQRVQVTWGMPYWLLCCLLTRLMFTFLLLIFKNIWNYVWWLAFRLADEGRMVQFLGGARDYSKDSSLLGHYILPSQVIIRWVRAFSQGLAATNYYSE